MKLPGHWRTYLLWSLGALAALAFVAFLVLLAREDPSPKAKRARTALLVGVLVAVLAAAAIEISQLVYQYYGRLRTGKPLARGAYNTTHTAVMLT